MKPKQAKRKSRVHRSEEVRLSEHTLRLSEGSIDQKTTLEFAKAKKPSSRQRTVGWTSKL